MFAADTGSLDPKYPVSTAIGKFLVSHGGSVIGSYGYGISPSSTRSAVGTVRSVIHAGGKQGVLDTSVPFGSVAFTTASLAAKTAHVNAIYAGMDDNSNFALATALKQAGVHLKAVVFPTGYEPSAINSPAWADLQGDYFDSEFRPFSVPNAGTKQMQAALEKFDHFSTSQFPTFDQYEGWLGADLMLDGIQKAGKNPTSAGVIKALRSVKSYNGGGLLPESINYSTIFGHDLPKACGWFVQAKKSGFVPTSSSPFCGTDIPGTSTATGG
jgi:branched-chain amino acid transport system substrate-binding protein